MWESLASISLWDIAKAAGNIGFSVIATLALWYQLTKDRSERKLNEKELKEKEKDEQEDTPVVYIPTPQEKTDYGKPVRWISNNNTFPVILAAFISYILAAALVYAPDDTERPTKGPQITKKELADKVQFALDEIAESSERIVALTPANRVPRDPQAFANFQRQMVAAQRRLTKAHETLIGLRVAYGYEVSESLIPALGSAISTSNTLLDNGRPDIPQWAIPDEVQFRILENNVAQLKETLRFISEKVESYPGVENQDQEQ